MSKQLMFAFVLALALVGVGPAAMAGAPQVRTQPPGYFRLMLGSFEVTALYDTGFKLDTAILRNAGPGELQRLLSRGFVPGPKVPATLMAYLVNTGKNLVLVDAGCGFMYKPSVSHLLDNLRAAGYRPAQVDTIVITHMHGDHVAGLVDGKGRIVFANAKVHVAQAESDFWLSKKIASAAPEAARHFFLNAQASAAPYVAGGQWKPFTGDREIVPGIKAIAGSGHTPGHTLYSVESEGQKLLIWGDLIHAPSVQFPDPGVTMDFDRDQKQAANTRLEVLRNAAGAGHLVAGMHLAFPGIGHVRADGEGAYSFVPVPWKVLPEGEEYVAGGRGGCAGGGTCGAPCGSTCGK